jgi:hypothetical protein
MSVRGVDKIMGLVCRMAPFCDVRNAFVVVVGT